MLKSKIKYKVGNREKHPGTHGKQDSQGIFFTPERLLLPTNILSATTTQCQVEDTIQFLFFKNTSINNVFPGLAN